MLRFSYFADVLPNSIHWFHYNIFEFLKMVWTVRDLKNLLVQTTPTIGRELSTVLWVAQSSIQSGLEHFQGWSIYNFSGEPVPGHHPHHEELIPNV